MRLNVRPIGQRQQSWKQLESFMRGTALPTLVEAMLQMKNFRQRPTRCRASWRPPRSRGATSSVS